MPSDPLPEPPPEPVSLPWRYVLGTIPKRRWSHVRICRKCKYPLLGLPQEGLCPECGQHYNRITSHLSDSQTPRQMRMAVLIYLVVITVVPAISGVLLGSETGRMCSVLVGIVTVPIACAKLCEAMVAKVAESHPSVPTVPALLFLLGVGLFFSVVFVGTLVLMASIVILASRLR